MYLLILKYIVPIYKIDEVLEEHGKFLDKYYSLKKFICSGRQNPRTGGVILCNACNIEEVNSIIIEDPFTVNGLVEYEIIEFTLTKCIEGFEALVNI